MYIEEFFLWLKFLMNVWQRFLKALSDETRLHIIDMLSCNELCAADILASFNLSQSTLSYHMKILIDAGVVNSQRNGLWTRYSINEDTFSDILEIIPQLYKTKDEMHLCTNQILPS